MIELISLGIATGFGLYGIFSLLGYVFYRIFCWIFD